VSEYGTDVRICDEFLAFVCRVAVSPEVARRLNGPMTIASDRRGPMQRRMRSSPTSMSGTDDALLECMKIAIADPAISDIDRYRFA
jgi:hypothetical protein